MKVHKEVDKAALILRPVADRGWSWLREAAFPLWLARGMDRGRGGFHERLTLEGAPTAHDRRAFVQARQAFYFCEAGRPGWNGAWQDAARHADSYLIERYFAPTEAIIHTIDPDGRPVDRSTDLYDVVFVLFALAHLYEVLGQDPPDLETALHILDNPLRERKHPTAGFVEASGKTLRQNPHMHRLEAALARFRAEVGERWWSLASELVALAERHVIDGESGAVFEHFAEDLTPLGGRNAAAIEPGHPYEWATLFSEWDTLRRANIRPACEHLFLLAEEYGRDPRGGVAVDDIDLLGRRTNRTARIWAQTDKTARCSHAAAGNRAHSPRNARGGRGRGDTVAPTISRNKSAGDLAGQVDGGWQFHGRYRTPRVLSTTS